MQIPDPKKDQSKVAGSAQSTASPLDRYTVVPKQQGADGGDKKSPYYQSQAPTISLPKGGGALKGIDEKFTVNAVNGTASLEVPLPLTPGRGEFTPKLSLQYNSGSGNSEFGLGWGLSLSSIQRKTDKKLPQYNDAAESDVFLMSGAEDLQPLLVPDGDDCVHEVFDTSDGFRIKRYRPRIEGLFARIEFISKVGAIDSRPWWKVTTKDNVVTFYGLTAEARIADPENENRIFKWLPQLSYDNKGNAMLYTYVTDNTTDIVPDAPHERNRKSGSAKFTNTYLAHVAYCNRTPYIPDASTTHVTAPILPEPEDFLMRCLFDYGGHDTYITDIEPVNDIPTRADAFSDFHAGFEVRTYRRCFRIVMLHYFDELDGGGAVVVKSLDLQYHVGSTPLTWEDADQVTSVTLKAYQKTGTTTYDVKALPPMVFEYSGLEWSKNVQEFSSDLIENIPQGLTGPYQWIDLWGEGLPGILTEQAGAWYYMQSNGTGRFNPAVAVAEKPSFQGLGGAMQWQDLDADGRRQLVSRNGAMPGYFELDDDQQWQSFRTFRDWINVNWDSPYTHMLDLNGDGRPDLLITEEQAWRWYENEGKDGFAEGGNGAVASDEELGPRMLHHDAIQTIFLADINGDGLTDLVRILNGEICYWPNLGYGRFGARITMTNSPHFDSPENFNPRRVVLADLTGTGAVDLLYFGDDFCNAWLNLAGNAWAQPRSMPFFGGLDQFGKVTVCDFYGNGTSCIVWSSSSLQSSLAPLRVVYLMGQEGKPYLMKACHNYLGKRTEISYLRSTIYYQQHKNAGTPWATRLPFPVHCVASQTIKDTVSQTQYTTNYSYHHGYYDHEEREFRGFGRVDTIDTEIAESSVMGVETFAPLQQKPVKTKTWYHTGAWMRDKTLIDAFLEEYNMVSWAELPVNSGSAAYLDMPTGLSAQEQREAYRALKGMPLRQEIYAIDDTAPDDIPYTFITNTYCVKRVQPLAGNRFASFHAYKQQTITYACERVVDDPRVQHELTLSADEYGNVLRAAKVTYPRSATAIAGEVATDSLPLYVAGKQAEALISFTDTAYTNDTDGNVYLLRLPYDVQTYQLTGASPGGDLWGVDALNSAIDGASLIAWTDAPSPGVEKRLLSHNRTTYLDKVANALPLGTLEDQVLVHRQYALAITEDMLLEPAYYDGRVSSAMLAEGGYIREDGITEFGSADTTRYWLQGGRVSYMMTHFCTPSAYQDPWDNVTTITWWDDAGDNYYLVPHTVTDAIGNVTTANAYNWYNLQPTQITDINNNESHILYDTLGLPTAIAIMEKDGSVNGDTLTGIDPLTEATLADNFFDDPVTYAGDVLQGATWRCLYRFGDAETPSCVAMLARVLHNSEDPDSPSLIRLTYTDGLGRVAMSKVQAAPEEGETDIRWIASGKTIYNNKGKVVQQYEPYYTTSHEYDNALLAATVGVSPKMYYDPMGRLERTEFPDGSITKTKWSPWAYETYDNNDTVIGSEWAARRTAPLGDLSGDANEVDAREKAERHDITTTVIHFDTLARPICTKQRNSIPDPSDPPNWMYELYISHVVLDIVGNRVEIEDARELTAHTYTSNMVGAVACHVSMDGGTQYLLADAAGQPLYAWDAAGNEFHFTYDELRRKLTKEVSNVVVGTKQLERINYGEGSTDSFLNNLRGKPMKMRDGTGEIGIDLYDFKGNPLVKGRSLADDYTQHPDWSTIVATSTVYTSSYAYDALSRPVEVTSPDDSITRYSYNETGLLYSLDVEDAGGTLTTDIVNEIYYNARGQRIKIKYENGATTTYTYDAETFRVRRIRTTRSSDSAVLQDLNYWYDPVGNITMQTDDAQQDVYYDNTVAEPTSDYTYDALYRLIICEGREHAGSDIPVSHGDSTRTGQNPLPTDASAMRRYTQYYLYDEVGNMLQMKHTTSGGVGNWTRNFEVDTASNRLLSTNRDSYGNVEPTPPAVGESYDYNPRGGVKAGFAHLSGMNYNEENRLNDVTDASTFVITYYQYDIEGNRVRKVTINSGASLMHEHVYLDGFEVYKKTDLLTSTVVLERDTLMVNDGESRVAIIDTPVIDTLSTGEVQTLRYQLSNHLGTASLELADDADVISYEEYYPFGNTSYQGGRGAAECSLKHYRYVGKERDNESGFYYIGARYYCPWLARWLAVDPINDEWYNMCKGNPTRNTERQFVELTASSYEYCYANPVRFTDPTGEQVPPIQYTNVHTTATTGVNPTPAQSGAAPSSADRNIAPTQAFVGGGVSGTNAVKELVKNLPKGGEAVKDIAASSGEVASGGVGLAARTAGLTIGLVLMPTSMGTGDVFYQPDGSATYPGYKTDPKRVEIPFNNPFEIKENDDNESKLYRFDKRSPSEISSQGGFKAWGTEMDLTLHALGISTFDQTSGYISTSKSESAIVSTLPEGASGYIYTIEWQATGIDINATLGERSPHPEEQEVAVPLVIFASDIIDVKPYIKK